MTTLQGCVDVHGAQERQFKLDSGAAISCISTSAFQKDKEHSAGCVAKSSLSRRA